jgi:hypothetical protein
MDSTPPSNDTASQTELKRKLWQSVVYKRPILNFTNRNKHWLRVKDWKIYQANGPWKQAGGVKILTSDKVDFKPTLVKRDKEGHFILIKEAILQKEITIINLNTPNVSAPISSNIH